MSVIYWLPIGFAILMVILVLQQWLVEWLWRRRQR